LVDAIGECIVADGPLGPIAVRYREEEGCWEIEMYPRPVELVGGAADGALVDPGYSLDLLQLHNVFEAVSDLTWNTCGDLDGEPPYVSAEGMYQGRQVFLRLLAAAPEEDEEPGMKIKFFP
jgi:hypothetical protein